MRAPGRNPYPRGKTMTRPARRRDPGAGRLIAGLLAALFGAVGRADIVATRHQRPAVDVRVTGLDQGRLHYRLPTGRTVTRPISEIEYLQVTGWPLFNLAEKQQRDGHLRQAVNAYEKLLAELPHTPPQQAPPSRDRPPVRPGDDPRKPGLDPQTRRLLVQCRLLRVYDGQGRFDRAVTLYLDVIEQMPALLKNLQPTRLPAPGSTFLDSALAQVGAAIERHEGDAVAVSLARWRATWPGQRAEDTRANSHGPRAADVEGGNATASRPAESPAVRQVRAKLAQIRAMVEGGQFDAALEAIEPLQSPTAGDARADLYYWQGRALLARSAGQTSQAAQQDQRRAGLAFMRVVIHFPRHAPAPESLGRAAEICQQFGQTDLAVGLWSELLRTYPTAGPWVERARQRSSGLK